MTSELLQGFYLGELLIEPLKGQVTGRDGAAHVPPKAAEVLLCLARSPGEVVTRDVLLERVWGAGKGSHEALSRAVSDIRHALNDHHDNPTFIQTLPKRGYRLLVSPETVLEGRSSIVLGHEQGARITDIGLLENLKRRGVLETAFAYLVVGWLMIQIADIVFAQLLLPNWAATFVTVLVIAGFPIAIVLSWYLDLRDVRTVLSQLTPVDARKRRFSRTYVSVVGALAIAALGVYVYDQSIGLPTTADVARVEPQQPRYEPPPIVEHSFAVLPFLNIDGSEEAGIFANGLVEDLIARLSRVPGLHVAARGDSYALAPNSSSQQVRERLRVQMYLEGSVEIFGQQMRVTLQMIDSATGFHILGRTFNRAREEFFDVRDEITSLMVANVRVALPADLQVASLKILDDPSLDAYVLYRRGIDTTRQPWSRDTAESALGWFDAALAIDDKYAAAYAGKCFVYAKSYAQVDDPVYVEKAESSCAKALELNPHLDIVHTSLGDLYLLTGRLAEAEGAYRAALATDAANVDSLKGLGDLYARQKKFDAAEASLRKAIDIHPGNASTYSSFGAFLFQTGRFAEAVEQYGYVVALQPDNMNGYANLGAAYMMLGDFAAAAPAYQRAIAIEPTKTAYSNLGIMHYYLGNFDVAIDNHASAVALQPNDYLAKSNLGDALWVAGREDEAGREFRKAEALAQGVLEINPTDPFTMMDLAWIRAMLGQRDAARALIDRALALAPDDPYTHYYDALVHLRAGANDRALDALETARAKGYPKQMLAAEPHLAPLRQDVRFARIIGAG